MRTHGGESSHHGTAMVFGATAAVFGGVVLLDVLLNSSGQVALGSSLSGVGFVSLLLAKRL